MQSTPGTDSDDRGPERRLTFALTWLAYASYYVGRKGFSIVKARLAEQLGFGTPTLAAIETAFLASYALGQVPSGVAADRIGARKLVGIGLLASACACAVFGALSSAYALGLAFALNGIAQATGWPGTTKAMADHTTDNNRGRVMGLWSTCYQVGGMAASALATFLLARYGWRSAFEVPAIWLVLVGALILWRLPNGTKVGSAAGTPSSDAAPRPSRLLLDPVIYGYGACYFCLKLIRYSLLFWLPYYLHTSVGFSDSESGYLSISFELGGVAGSIGLGFLSDRVTRWGQRSGNPLASNRASVAIVALLGLAWALVLYARIGHAGAGLHFSLMALVGALLFGPDSLLSGAAAQDAGGARSAATAVGVVNGMGSAGALLQGVLTVGVQQHFGWTALFYVFIALALLGAACLVPSVRLARVPS